MQLTVPPDLEALVQKRLDAEESWTGEECSALDEKIDRAMEQVAADQVYGPAEARRKLAASKVFTHSRRSRWKSIRMA